MAVRGAVAKEEVKNKIFEIFGDNVFMNGKEIRICCTEDNEPIEVKITLTAAKDNVRGGNRLSAEPKVEEKKYVEPTDIEKERMAKLFESLG